MSRTPILHRADYALWRLPRWARKIVVAPVALLCAFAEAWDSGASEFSSGWRSIMDHVHDHPRDWPPDPSEGRGALASTDKEPGR